jgi:hypothetical protein
LRSLVRVQLRSPWCCTRVKLGSVDAHLPRLVLQDPIEHDSRNGEPERGAELCHGLEERASNGLFVGEGNLRYEDGAGGKDKVSAEDRDNGGGKAEGPIWRGGNNDCKEQCPDAGEEGAGH